ncbi:MAG: DegV family protein [Ruthenibacterium lactatiformans]
MREYKILTDSTTDLSPQLVAQTGVTVLPMTYTIGEKSYRNDPEETDLSSGDFYDMLRGGAMSTTSQINVETFREVAGQMARDGFDVLYVGFSSGLSGTFNSARIAFEDLSAEYPEHKFLAVDSLCASMGEGLLVYHAAQQQKAGRSIEETARWLEENKLHLAHWFTVDDLNHLKRGGRVSGAAAFFGTMLNIKPVLHVDDAGSSDPHGKGARPQDNLDALVAHMEKDAVDPASQTVFISHGDCRADAEYVADLVREKFGTQDIIHSIGPVIGSHSGPGTVALFYLGRTRG